MKRFATLMVASVCIGVFVGLLGYGAPQGTHSPSTKIIDTAKYGSGFDESNETLLTINQDGRIGVEWRLAQGGSSSRTRSAEIGQAVWSSGDVDLRTRIPRTEIPFFATRVTNPGSNTVLHVVVTAFLAKTQKRTAANRVYVFAEKKNGVVVLDMNDYDKVNRAFLDDINGDGQPEVAVEWLEDMGKIGGLDIWTVSSADQLSSLTIPEPPANYVEEFSTDLTRFVGEYTGPGNRTIVQSIYIAASGAPFTRRIYYRWDKSSRRYQVKEIQEVRETIKKLSVDPTELTLKK